MSFFDSKKKKKKVKEDTWSNWYLDDRKYDGHKGNIHSLDNIPLETVLNMYTHPFYAAFYNNINADNMLLDIAAPLRAQIFPGRK